MSHIIELCVIIWKTTLAKFLRHMSSGFS